MFVFNFTFFWTKKKIILIARVSKVPMKKHTYLKHRVSFSSYTLESEFQAKSLMEFRKLKTKTDVVVLFSEFHDWNPSYTKCTEIKTNVTTKQNHPRIYCTLKWCLKRMHSFRNSFRNPCHQFFFFGFSFSFVVSFVVSEAYVNIHYTSHFRKTI